MTDRSAMIRMACGLALFASPLLTSAALDAQSLDSARFPWKKGDPAPVIAGIALHASARTVDSVLGKAKETRVLETGTGGDTTRELEFPKRGLRVTVNDRAGVTALELLTRDAGALDSLRVEDKYGRVISHWGRPDWIESGALFYSAGEWVIIVGWERGGAKVAWLQVTLANR